jgi:ADP-ribose pyrophosphatase YjhB (NUDIX family)
MTPKKIPYEEFEKIYSRVPRLCVDLVIKSKEGIVLSKRLIPPYKGYWHTPGGTVLYGETLEEAVKRVAKEETGLNVEIIKLAGVIEFPKIKSLKHAVSIGYLVKPISGKLRGSDQGSNISYFKQIPPNTVPAQETFIKQSKLI